MSSLKAHQNETCILVQYFYTLSDRKSRAEHNYVVIFVRYTVRCKLWGFKKVLHICYGGFSRVNVLIYATAYNFIMYVTSVILISFFILPANRAKGFK